VLGMASNNINPGQLRHKILIQSLETIQTNVVDWVDYKTLWAKIDYQISKSSSTSQVRKDDTIKCILRYTQQIDPSMRIVFLGKIFNIVNIDFTKYANKFIEVIATEVLPKTCIIYRNAETKDSLNRPQLTLNKVYQYPCTIMRKNTDYIQQTPNAIIEDRFVLIGLFGMNVQAGDLIEIDSIKYIASTPFNPNKYQTEVEITVKKDV
jgi:SPP1 family predicted phage head-tail adaptor